MRTNSLGFALTVGMGLIVILMCYAALSAAGLVGFAAADAAQELQQPAPLGKDGMVEGPRFTASASIPTGELSPEAQHGDALFKANCTQCHAVNEQVVGPALAGITKRRPIAWIIPWVHNSAKVVASGDEYAVALYSKFQKQQMPSFQLSDKDIKDIVAYIESQEGAGVSAGVADQAVAVN